MSYVCQCIRFMVITDQLGFNRKNLSLGGVLAKESIIEGRAINLASLDKNLLLRGNCSRRIFEDLRCNSVKTLEYI